MFHIKSSSDTISNNFDLEADVVEFPLWSRRANSDMNTPLISHRQRNMCCAVAVNLILGKWVERHALLEALSAFADSC